MTGVVMGAGRGGGAAATRIMLLIPSSLFFKLELPPSSSRIGRPDESPVPFHSFRGFAPLDVPNEGDEVLFEAWSRERLEWLLG